MASIRTCRPLTQFASILRQQGALGNRQISTYTAKRLPARAATNCRVLPHTISSFHTSPRRDDGERAPTDFGALDVLGNTPVPSTSIDVCMSDGFHLNSGARILDGAGVLLVGGEAFSWRPWLSRGEKRLLNKKGQWEVSNDTLGLLGLIWPRPGIYDHKCKYSVGVHID